MEENLFDSMLRGRLYFSRGGAGGARALFFFNLIHELNNKQCLERRLSKNLILLLRGQIEPIFVSLKGNLRLHFCISTQALGLIFIDFLMFFIDFLMIFIDFY